MSDAIENGHATEVAKLLKALAHPERLLVLCALVEGERGVSELQARSTLGQSAFSQQLAVLRRAELIKARKVGLQIFYSLANPVVQDLLQVLHQHYCSDSNKSH